MTSNQLHPTWYRYELETIFQFVVKCGFITKPLLADLFAIENQRTLDRLASAVSRCKFLDPYLSTFNFQGWRLGRSGKYEARSRGLKASYPPKFSSRNHDEMALSIAIQLERRGLITEWSPEVQFVVEPSNRLMVSQDSRGQKYPDLVLSLANVNQPFRVAVELELSRKSLSRYEKALTGYMAVRGIDAVIFAVTSPFARRSIESAIRRTRIDQNRLPILFVDARALYDNPVEAYIDGAQWSGTFGTLSTLKGVSCAA